MLPFGCEIVGRNNQMSEASQIFRLWHCLTSRLQRSNEVEKSVEQPAGSTKNCEV